MEHYCVHCLETVPGIPVRNETLFQKHLFEAHGIRYIEKKKVEKNHKAEMTWILPSTR